MAESTEPLYPCSNCRTKKLASYFTIKATTGRMLKTCNACRIRGQIRYHAANKPATTTNTSG